MNAVQEFEKHRKECEQADKLELGTNRCDLGKQLANKALDSLFCKEVKYEQ